MGVCGSRDAQSPIDISVALKDPTLQRLKFWYPVDQSTGISEFDDDPRSALSLAYDGQALSVNNFQEVMNNVEAGAPFVLLDGKERFNLASLFIRSESEHTLEGVRYPLELQLIHRHVRDVHRAVAVSLFFDVADRIAFS
jgi:carbonic anhydrase